MLDQENKTHVEKSTANININININNNDLSNSDPSSIFNNPLNDHDYCKHVANSLEKHNANNRSKQTVDNQDQHISNNQDQQIANNRAKQMIIDNRNQDNVNSRQKRQRKEVFDPEFSQFTSSSEYSSSDAESDQESSADSENDPNRPWCDCERPDDGNFMIECEICKYWFHGSCVGMTRALSRKYEKQGKEFFCSSCDHALQSGTPRDAIPPRLVKKEKKKTGFTATKRRGRPRKSDTPNREVTTRQSLRSAKRANSSTDSNLKSKGKSNARTESFEKFDDQRRLKELIKERKREFLMKHRLSVQFQDDKRKKMGLSRHSVTGPLGHSLDSVASITSNPDMSNLPINIKSELKDKSKPNIVLQINRKKDDGTEASGQRIVTTIVKKRKASESSDSNVNELFTADPIQLSKKTKSHADRMSTPTLSKTKEKVSGDATSQNGDTKLHVTSDQLEASSTQKRKSKGTEPTATNGSSKHVDSSHIIQKIKECLDSRGKHLTDLDMTSIDTEKLASEIVSQLNECFKVGSSKYLPKYRSLIFNLRDQKNQALVRNVLTGEIAPSRLVRMSPDEMAPNELAKWRERENKHSIELIKRDAELAVQQVIVKKTHKGEEVIAAPAPNDPDDPTAAKEDQELPSTPTKASGRTDGSKVSASPALADVSRTDVTPIKDLDTGPQHPAEKSDKDPPSIFLPVSLEAPQTNNEHLSGGKDVEQSSTSKQQDIKLDVTEKTSVKIEQEPIVAQPKRLRISIDTRLDPANLSRLTEPLIKPVENPSQSVEYSPSKISPNAGSGSNDDEEENEDLYDPETSTIPKRISNQTEQQNTNDPCWSGTITMSEVGKFDAMARPVSGNPDFMKNEVNQTLLVCGRIDPDRVTPYIKQLKSTQKNQMFLVQLYPLTEKDKASFATFLNYLYKKNRWGVISTSGSTLKDFYVLPISNGGRIPDVLKPINGPGLDRKEQDCLLGLLVKTNRPSSASSSASSYTPSSIK